MPVTNDSYSTAENTALIVGKGANFDAQGSAAGVTVQTFAPNIGFIEAGTGSISGVSGYAGDIVYGFVTFGTDADSGVTVDAGAMLPTVSQGIGPITLNQGQSEDMSQYIFFFEGSYTTSIPALNTGLASYSDTTKLLTHVADGTQNIALQVDDA